MKSGDILAYRGTSILARIVRWWSKSEYSHVAVVVRFGEENFFADATLFKGVTIQPLNVDQENHEVISTPVKLSTSARNFILKSIGQRYSIIDAVRAGFGLKQKNPGWQCAEFAANVLSRCGLKGLERPNLTPSELIQILQNPA